MKHYFFTLELQIREDGYENELPSNWIVSARDEKEAVDILCKYMLEKYAYINTGGNVAHIWYSKDEGALLEIAIQPSNKTPSQVLGLYLPWNEEGTVSKEINNQELEFFKAFNIPSINKKDLGTRPVKYPKLADRLKSVFGE